MTLLTIGQYLIGNRDAILCIARCPQALWIGLLFVIAAGFAREYDGEDLLHEPWHLFIPLGASVASSAVLYALVRFIASIRRAAQPSVLAGSRAFLTLYWMTAPLALLYAIPFERFLSAEDSVGANLTLLGLVAAWRVVLMSRVVSVIYAAGIGNAFFLVMTFADTLAIIILVATPLPIVSIMGGIRLSESEALLHGVVWILRVLTVLSWPVWAIGTAVIGIRRTPGWSYMPTPLANANVHRHLWAVGIGCCLMWALVLPATQAEQQRRRYVESLLQAGRIEEGLQEMSRYERDGFPPHWDPPPRVAYHEQTPNILKVIEQLDEVNMKSWVVNLYREKFSNALRGHYDGGGVWSVLSPEEFDRYISVIEAMPGREQVIRDHQEPLSWLARKGNKLPPELRERIQTLLREAGVAAKDEEPEWSTPENRKPDAESSSP
jgi:hypothetical protein